MKTEIPVNFAVPYGYWTIHMLYGEDGKLRAMIEVEGARLWFGTSGYGDGERSNYLDWCQETVERIRAECEAYFKSGPPYAA